MEDTAMTPDSIEINRVQVPVRNNYSSSIEPHLGSGLALVKWLHGPEPQMPPPLSVVDGLFEMYHVPWGTLASSGGGGPRSGSDGEHV